MLCKNVGLRDACNGCESNPDDECPTAPKTPSAGPVGVEPLVGAREATPGETTTTKSDGPDGRSQASIEKPGGWCADVHKFRGKETAAFRRQRNCPPFFRLTISNT